MTGARTARPSWHDARESAIEAGRSHALPSRHVPLAGSVGLVVARHLVARGPIPHYDSAAMDGWAVSGDGPWTIDPTPGPPDPVGPLVDAGTVELLPGHAREIVTGALVPRGATAVLRSEHSVARRGLLDTTHRDEPRAGHHIRRAGREAHTGETLIEAGTMLNPAHVALAASAGVDSLTVHAVPEVVLLLTGDEVAASGAPSPGRVRDGFGVQLPGLLEMLGGHVTSTRRVADDLDATVDALSSSREPLVITTGGTGTSPADHLRDALRTLGARFLVDGVAMRPGGPTCVAELPDGRLVLALPGNPLAAMVALISLGGPLLESLSGREATALTSVAAREMTGRPGTTLVVPYRLSDGVAIPTGWEGSAMMRGLATARGLLVVPQTGIREGDLAETVGVPWL